MFRTSALPATIILTIYNLILEKFRTHFLYEKVDHCYHLATLLVETKVTIKMSLLDGMEVSSSDKNVVDCDGRVSGCAVQYVSVDVDLLKVRPGHQLN